MMLKNWAEWRDKKTSNGRTSSQFWSENGGHKYKNVGQMGEWLEIIIKLQLYKYDLNSRLSWLTSNMFFLIYKWLFKPCRNFSWGLASRLLIMLSDCSISIERDFFPLEKKLMSDQRWGPIKKKVILIK